MDYIAEIQQLMEYLHDYNSEAVRFGGIILKSHIKLNDEHEILDEEALTLKEKNEVLTQQIAQLVEDWRRE